ncbi:MAG: murein biosynthesis integral membrane protein MurJ [Proteobacteria bacterium]|nr:murein biosynthesis integral membrane protein MurJ [Pseudomonadota bacterium]
MGIAKKSGLSALAIFLSRILGLLREQAFASLFGAGFFSDAFLVAFRIPNLFRDLFAEGALSSSFVSVLSKEDSLKKQKDLSNDLFLALFWILIMVMAVMFFMAPDFVNLLASNFKNHIGKFEITLHLTYWLLPTLLFSSLAAFSMGILNTQGSFFIPSLSPAFFNIGSVLLGASSAFYCLNKGEARLAIVFFAIGTMVGSFLQWAIQWPSLIKKGFSPLNSIKNLLKYAQVLKSFKNPKVYKIFILILPAVLSVAFVQISIFINTSFASGLEEGSVSWLNYAYRILHFPMGLFGVAISLASLPGLSKLSFDPKAFQESLASSLRMSLILAWGSAMGLIFFGRVIVALIFQHGSFDPIDTYETSQALAAYGVGLIAFNLNKVLLSAYYALESVLIPSVAAVFSLVINFYLAKVLSELLGHSGLALCVSIAGISKLFFMLAFLWKKSFLKMNYRILGLFLVLIMASLPMLLSHFMGLEDWLFEILRTQGKTCFIPMVLMFLGVLGISYLVIVSAFTPEGRILIKKISFFKKSG